MVSVFTRSELQPLLPIYTFILNHWKGIFEAGSPEIVGTDDTHYIYF